MTLAERYQERFERCLVPTTSSLQDYAQSLLQGQPCIDAIRSRAKRPDRFLEKAARVDPKGGLRYADPLIEIQDQIGLRVVVYYEDLVPAVSDELLRYFRSIEDREITPESPWEFGYVGLHHILVLPDDVVSNDCDAWTPQFFELQVKTLFQHAWSEAEHDVWYKPEQLLDVRDERLLAYSAAQAWGADRAFTELRTRLVGRLATS
jgi:putative GTP pyrophosphokinase